MSRVGQIFRGVLARLRSIFHVKNLRTTIALSFIIIMAIVYGGTYYAFSQKFEQTVRRNMESVSVQTTDELAHMVTRQLSEAESMADAIGFQLLLYGAQDEAETRKLVRTMIGSKQGVASVSLFDSRGALVASSSGKPIKETVDVTNQPWYLLAKGAHGDRQYSGVHVENLFAGQYPWVVSLSQSMQPGGSGQPMVLLINLDVSNLYGRSEKFTAQTGSYAYLLDSSGHYLVHPHIRLIHNGLLQEDSRHTTMKPGTSFISKEDGQEQYTVVRNIPPAGWKLVYNNYVTDVMVPRAELTRFLLITIALGIVVIIIVSLLVSNLVTRPLGELGQAMAKVEQGKMDAVAHVRGETEIEQLAETYNRMIARIQQLMEEKEREQEGKRKFELRALQMQIQPHFLYNTLESIIWAAEGGQTEEVVHMTSALSRLFRASLADGGDMIPVSQELRHVKSYLTIQGMRYKEQICWSVHATADARRCYTVKLLLQPLVENAIYHGLRELGEPGRIDIFAWTAADSLYFAVTDNGLGMDNARMHQVMDGEFVSEGGSGLGLYNVHERIRLHFGNEYGLRMASQEEEGTAVLLTLPAIYTREELPS